jgi:hypothetical protein
MKYHIAAKPAAALTVLIASAWLAGCAGSPTPVSPSSQAFSPAVAQNGPSLDLVGGAPSQCGNPPLQISPCNIHLTRGDRQQAITVKSPPGNIIEKNNCRRGHRRGKFHRDRRNIAGVHGGGSNWVVTAGNERGFCKIEFTFEGKGPSATGIVLVQNSVQRKRHRR